MFLTPSKAGGQVNHGKDVQGAPNQAVPIEASLVQIAGTVAHKELKSAAVVHSQLNIQGDDLARSVSDLGREASSREVCPGRVMLVWVSANARVSSNLVRCRAHSVTTGGQPPHILGTNEVPASGRHKKAMCIYHMGMHQHICSS